VHLKTRQLLSSLLEDPFSGAEAALGLEEPDAEGDDAEGDDFELPEDSDDEDSDDEDFQEKK
jgi:hypothetical protein